MARLIIPASLVAHAFAQFQFEIPAGMFEQMHGMGGGGGLHGTEGGAAASRRRASRGAPPRRSGHRRNRPSPTSGSSRARQLRSAWLACVGSFFARREIAAIGSSLREIQYPAIPGHGSPGSWIPDF